MTDPKGKSLLEKIRARMPRQEEASMPAQDRHHEKFWEIFFKDSQAACMPAEWQHELANYLLHGFTPGSFHRAVVENNLAAATRNTHQSNEWIWICGFMWFLQRYAPPESWGSTAKVKKWLRMTLEQRFEINYKKGLVMTDLEVTFKVVQDSA
jgi:hypothetical protein